MRRRVLPNPLEVAGIVVGTLPGDDAPNRRQWAKCVTPSISAMPAKVAKLVQSRGSSDWLRGTSSHAPI